MGLAIRLYLSEAKMGSFGRNAVFDAGKMFIGGVGLIVILILIGIFMKECSGVCMWQCQTIDCLQACRDRQ
jgi:hypothetical protein